MGAAPYTLQASHPRHCQLRMAPLEAPQRVVSGVAHALPTKAPHPLHWQLRLAPSEAQQSRVWYWAWPNTLSRPLILGTGHSGLPPLRRSREWYWAWPQTPSLQAFHPRHWPLRLAFLAHRRGCHCACPLTHTFPGLSSPALATQDCPFPQRHSRAWYLARPLTHFQASRSSSGHLPFR